jgi:hypothetical protein
MTAAWEHATELEAGYRRLLRLYPRDHRHVHEEEMMGVLMDMTAPEQRRPRVRDALDLAYGALRIQLSRTARIFGGPWAEARAAATVIALTAQALLSITGALVFLLYSPDVDLLPGHQATYLPESIVLASSRLYDSATGIVPADVLTVLAALVAAMAAMGALAGRRVIAACFAWGYAAMACAGFDVVVSANGALNPSEGFDVVYDLGLYAGPLATVLIALLATVPPGAADRPVRRHRVLLWGVAAVPLLAAYFVAAFNTDSTSTTLLIAFLAIPAGQAIRTPIGRRTLALLLPLAAGLLRFCGGVDFGDTRLLALLVPLLVFYSAGRSRGPAIE